MPPRKQVARPLLTSWSYSRYSMYKECPYKLYLSAVARHPKLVEEKNEALLKGDRVHKGAEAYVGGGPATALPKELAGIKNELTDLRKAKAKVEVEWAFDRQYSPVSWFAKTAWLRVKVDAYSEVYTPKPLLPIIDYKTGKVYDDHRQQRSLYGMAGLHMVSIGAVMSKLKNKADVTVTASHWYTDIGHKDTETFGMASLKPLMREWGARTKEMLNDTVYRAHPSPRACRFCPYKQSIGGPCPEA